jgi:hypothetical protein
MEHRPPEPAVADFGAGQAALPAFSTAPAGTIDIRPHYNRASRPAPLRRIPRRFVQTWKTGFVDAPQARRMIEFRNQHPDFDFEFYDDDRMHEYMFDNWAQHPIFEIFKNSKWGASRADIWRYCVLHQHGGIYLDFDSSINFDLNMVPEGLTELISFESNPLTQFVIDPSQPNFEFFRESGFREPLLGVPANPVVQWCLMFAPQHPIMALAIELIVKHAPHYRNRRFLSVHNAIINFTAPLLLTQAVWTYRRAGHPVNQLGIDFNGLATFKRIEAPEQSVYVRDLPQAYHDKRNDVVLQDALRLNLGCGTHPAQGFVNIDMVPADTRVVAGDVRGLDYPPGSVDEIYARDVLEHMGFPDAQAVIGHWCSLLKVGGVITIQSTCIDLFLEAHRRGKITLAALNYLLFAGVSWLEGQSAWNTPEVHEADWHRSVFTVEFLSQALLAQGCEILSVQLDDVDDFIGDPFSGGVHHGLNLRVRACRRAAERGAVEQA